MGYCISFPAFKNIIYHLKPESLFSLNLDQSREKLICKYLYRT